jgi:thiamine pyrophosphate-dependent acetolactate synthase large subunit-like protein
MIYYAVYTAKYTNMVGFSASITVKNKEYTSEEEAEADFEKLLNENGVAFIQVKPTTYNNYINAEVKTERDMTYGNDKQIRYTKDPNFILDEDWCKTIIT